jgi:hypothetical protein
MTTARNDSLHPASTLPRLRVGRPSTLLAGLAVTLLCLALGIGFVAQVARGPGLGATARERNASAVVVALRAAA